MRYTGLQVFFVRLIALTLLLFVAKGFAQTEPDNDKQSHERLYQVELIIFSRPESSTQESWPSNLSLKYPDNLVTIKTDSTTGEAFTALPANERQLNNQAATLAKSGSYTLLYHQAWRQMIYGKKSQIAISAGKTFNGHQELEGSIALSVGQFLKLQTNLWLTQFVPAGTAVTETWPELPAVPFLTPNENNKTQDYLIKRIVKINEARSMRSNEVHYIDHPLLGIIVKIIPVDLSKNETPNKPN